MRIIGLLSFYNESPAMLSTCVSSITPFVDHLVAVDGAYSFFPDAQPTSPLDQINTIRDTAIAHNIGVTIHQPQHPWRDNEVEKRSFMFHLAEALTTEDDWYYVVDADEQVTHHIDPRPILEQTDLHCGEVTYWWHRPHETPDDRPFPSPLREQQGIVKFFRALRGLHCDTAHYRYTLPDGRRLWDPSGHAEEPANLRDIRVQHRNQERDLWRQQDAATYYTRRDTYKIEHKVPA